MISAKPRTSTPWLESEVGIGALPGLRSGVLLVAFVFLLSRIAYFLLGVRFDATPLNYNMQYPDPLLLRTDLLRTSYYFHMTPPLYNLFLGVFLKVFGDRYATALHAVYLAAGLLLAVFLYLLMRSLKASQPVSLLLTVLFVASPATVIYENWLYPDYLVAALLTVAAWMIGRAVNRRSQLALAGFFVIAGTIVLGRNYYHLAWLVLCTVILMITVPWWRPRILVAAALPILLCAGLYLKNYEVLGFFGSSSSSGINADALTTIQLSQAERQQLRDEGKLSALVDDSGAWFLNVDSGAWFAAHPGLFDPRTGVPVLDQVSKSTGAPNWGNRGWMQVWNQFSSDAAATVKAKPVVVLRAVRMGLLILFLPSDQQVFVWSNHTHVQTLTSLADTVLYGQPTSLSMFPPNPAGYIGSHLGDRLREVGWLIVAAYLLALGYGSWSLVRHLRAPERGETAMVAFALFTVPYILVVDVFFGIPDNNRYRFMADPLVMALLAVSLTGLMSRLRWFAQLRRSAALPNSRG